MAEPMIAQSACTAYTRCMQYTIRAIPAGLDAALRRRAKATGRSLNQVAVETLAEGAGSATVPRRRRNFGDIASTWKDDKAFDAAIAAQDQVDEGLWR